MRMSWLFCGLLVAAGAVHAKEAPPANLLDPARIATLPRQQARMDVHGHPLQCEGVSLAALLRASGAMPATPLRGADLAKMVRIKARDGYQVAFSLGELDDTLGAREVLLSDRCDGQPLPAEDGPWRLLVPADHRAARAARQVERIEVGP
ncbi:hypothetical protein ARC20_10810 [Stenotrophomonas panacihumi]|uniref:Oxidoreductase molybdopterin-binding domain-containing protein n=1 Tax=Stenotrophomonas panacihumi TaxID=676599 RepID=A0A0R0AMV9_9GAMM|nr:molybdopterin-dependent oxidoreductase [Stenotrophomonas panacihumi]KRG42353.1 hypothetical protein ARC20_10810 [Stenotrophomonas panacihumi]PTN54506.1 hypothetical protein C9J98_09690 [Stenotrophomonas panacihumi]